MQLGMLSAEPHGYTPALQLLQESLHVTCSVPALVMHVQHRMLDCTTTGMACSLSVCVMYRELDCQHAVDLALRATVNHPSAWCCLLLLAGL